MKIILFFGLCCLFQGLYAQKQPKYIIEIDSTKEHKYKTYNKNNFCECCIVPGCSPHLHSISCQDTTAALYIEYEDGLEKYMSYYSHFVKQRVETKWDTLISQTVPIDTAWLKKQVRHVVIYLKSEYSELEWDYAKEQNKIDSVNFIQEWALFERFLAQYQNIETMSIRLTSSYLITKYLQQDFHLPPSIMQLKKLQHLKIYLEDADVVSLPIEILKIKNLNGLGLYHDGIYTGLEQLKSHKKLKHLGIDSSIFEDSFPLWLYEMHNLKTLSLSCCFINPQKGSHAIDIFTIPNGISKLKKLRGLHLGPWCTYSITGLPVDELCIMKKLKHISVRSSLFLKNKTQIEQLKKHLNTYHFYNYWE